MLLSFGLFGLVINAFLLWLTDKLIDDFEIDSIRITLVMAVLLTVGKVVLQAILGSRISDLAVVLYRQDQSPRLDFWGSDVRSHTTEGDTQWVNYKPSPFSSRSMAS